MAKFIKHSAVLLFLVISIGLAKCGRQKSPLIVEDEGNRRNRPAGMWTVIMQMMSHYEASSMIAKDMLCWGRIDIFLLHVCRRIKSVFLARWVIARLKTFENFQQKF